MSAAIVPRRFVDLTNLDPEDVNANLYGLALDIKKNLDRRYTYSSIKLDLAGITDASDVTLRTLPVRRPSSSSHNVHVIGAELVLYGNAAVTATVSCSDTSFPSFTLATSATTTVETFASSFSEVDVPSGSDLTFTVALSAAYTCTAGFLIVHLRCDRGNQGASHAGYTPTPITSQSATAGATLDTQLTNAATAVGHDTTNQTDLRASSFTARSLGAGASRAFRVPSGVVQALRVDAYVVGTAALTITFSNPDTTNVSVITTGATTRVYGGADDSTTLANAPTTAASDYVCTITNTGGSTLALAFVLVWWQ